MEQHVCPWWMGYVLVNPLRRMFEKPENIVGPYLRQGMRVLDVGCGMGYFSLPMAKLVGEEGSVTVLDIQERMLASLKKRALKAGLEGRIEARLCSQETLGIDDLCGQIDFALAYAVIHETQNKAQFFSELSAALKKRGKLFVAEPPHHVSKEAFDASLAVAADHGFLILERPKIRGKEDRSALMELAK